MKCCLTLIAILLKEKQEITEAMDWFDEMLDISVKEYQRIELKKDVAYDAEIDRKNHEPYEKFCEKSSERNHKHRFG